MRRPVYHSLDDFLATHPLTVDGMGQDGAFVGYPVKGIETDATVLFCDISNFSGRTFDLSPTETLAYVNHFFTWISEESLHGRPGIVDKYIGDEIMVVFSREFGSEDPFLDAIQTAKTMIEYDPWAFEPHIGVASGPVTVGYVGTPLKYNCSVFGQCVAIAARCAGIKVVPPGNYGGWVTFPAAEWGTRELNAVAPPHNYQNPDGTTYTEPFNRWEISDVRKEPFKNMGDFEVRQLVKTSIWVPFETSAEAHAQALIAAMKADGRYRPVNG